MFKTVILSDGQPCKVRVMGLYELGDMAPEIVGPYRYSMMLATGDIVEDEYIPPATPPVKPDKPVEECEPNSYEYGQWQEYNTYLAAVAHEQKRTESYEDYLNWQANYIMTNCLEGDDKKRVVTLEDWRKVQTAALVPQLTEEVIADTLRSTFQGQIW